MMILNNRYEDYASLTARQAMEDTLRSACHRNIWNLEAVTAEPLPEDLSSIAQSYLSDVLAFISSCTQEMMFCCSVVFASHKNRFPSSECTKVVSKDQVSYSIGSKLGYMDTIYSVDDDDRLRLLRYVTEYIADELDARKFIVSVTPSPEHYRIFISWGIDKEAVGYAFHITDYSQIDAIKCGVPASDVFA